jgi:hypothetical protein
MQWVNEAVCYQTIDATSAKHQTIMDIITLPGKQRKKSTEPGFDKKSRENYFEMLHVALENLSIVYEHNGKGIVHTR